MVSESKLYVNKSKDTNMICLHESLGFISIHVIIAEIKLINLFLRGTRLKKSLLLSSRPKGISKCCNNRFRFLLPLKKKLTLICLLNGRACTGTGKSKMKLFVIGESLVRIFNLPQNNSKK